MRRAFAACSVACVLSGAPVAAAERPAPARLVALVGSQPITLAELAAGLRGRGIAPTRAPHSVWLAELEAAIDRAVLLQAARAETRQGAPKVSGARTPPRQPAAAGRGEKQRRDDDTLVRRYIARHFSAKLFVSAREIRAWYNRNKTSLRTGEVRTARVITIGARRRSEFVTDARAAALREMKLVRTKAVTGADFAALARKHSMDPYARRGGLLPPVRKTGDANVSAEVFKIAKPGGVSEIFETPFGLHIVKLGSVRAGVIPALSEAEGVIRQRIRAERWAAYIRLHIAVLRGRADIRIFAPNLPRPSGRPAPASD